MNEVAKERQLFREAVDLAIGLQNDPADASALETVRNWVALGPDHAATWARVAAIHGMTGKIFTDQRQVTYGSAPMSRRAMMIGGLVGAGAIATGALTVPGLLLRARADAMTATAELRRLELPDGSVMTLGPNSAMVSRYSATRRDIELLAGMAFFEVAADPARPFAVTSGAVTATALGTAFDVSNDAGYISVAVDHGTVEAKASGTGKRLGAGEWLTFDPSSQNLNQGSREAFQIGAWRTGMLIAEHETVSALVAKIARWLEGSVVVADPFLGSRVVSGVFDLNDPISALEAVVRPFGAKVRTVVPFMTVISPV